MVTHRIETADGVREVECTKSNPQGEDCQLCNRAKDKQIKEWLKLHDPYCIFCDEKPKCYQCLRKECDEWLKDKNFIEEFGTLRGCPNMILNLYCEKFVCKHRFVGWWNKDWKKRFNKVCEKAGKDIKLAKREQIKKERRKKLKKAKKNKPLQEERKNVKVITKVKKRRAVKSI